MSQHITRMDLSREHTSTKATSPLLVSLMETSYLNVPDFSY